MCLRFIVKPLTHLALKCMTLMRNNHIIDVGCFVSIWQILGTKSAKPSRPVGHSTSKVRSPNDLYFLLQRTGECWHYMVIHCDYNYFTYGIQQKQDHTSTLSTSWYGHIATWSVHIGHHHFTHKKLKQPLQPFLMEMNMNRQLIMQEQFISTCVT